MSPEQCAKVEEALDTILQVFTEAAGRPLTELSEQNVIRDVESIRKNARFKRDCPAPTNPTVTPW